jgi:hypothetical protein
LPDADERTPTPITAVGAPSRRRRVTRAGGVPAAGRHASWPEAAVSVTRIVVGNAVVGYLALRGIVPAEAALIALAVGALPAPVRLIAAAFERRRGR